MCYHVSAPQKTNLSTIFDREIKIHDYQPRYHVSGYTHPELAVMQSEAPEEIRPIMWGFMPEEMGPTDANAYLKTGYSLNAKAETIFKLDIYKKYALNKRCLVFVDGFYEWKHETIGGKLVKVPHYIQMPDHKPFALAGLYSLWEDKEEKVVTPTHNILTTYANELMATIHNSQKRMPLILDKKDWDLWLDTSAKEEHVKTIMKKYPEGILDAHEVNLSLKRGVVTDVPESQIETPKSTLF